MNGLLSTKYTPGRPMTSRAPARPHLRETHPPRRRTEGDDTMSAEQTTTDSGFSYDLTRTLDAPVGRV